MCIPPAFARHIRVNKSATATLNSRTSIPWHVKVDRKCNVLFLRDGWREFVEHHSLQYGDFLVFKHNGDLDFDVQIFGRSGCERVGACLAKSGTVHKVEEAATKPHGPSEDPLNGLLVLGGAMGNKPLNPGKALFLSDNPVYMSTYRYDSKRRNVTNEERLKALEAADSLKLKRPHFMAAMSKSNVSQGRSFSSEVKNYSSYSLKRKVSDESDEHNELNHIKGPVYLRSLDYDVAEKDMQNNFLQKAQNEKFISQPGEPAINSADMQSVRYCSGTTYRNENKRIGDSSKGEAAELSISQDLISLKQASSSDQKMFPFPAAKKKPNGGPGRRPKWNGPTSQSGCLEILKSGQSGVTVKRSTYTRAFVSGRRPVTDDEKTRTKTAALAFQSVLPFFVVVMKATFVSRGFYMVHLPQLDAKFMLRTGDGRDWQVSYLYKEGRSGFLGGWEDFVFANNLEEGDACVFEFIKGGKELAMDVTIFRVVEQITPLTIRYYVQNLKETPKVALSR